MSNEKQKFIMAHIDSIKKSIDEVHEALFNYKDIYKDDEGFPFEAGLLFSEQLLAQAFILREFFKINSQNYEIESSDAEVMH